MRYKAAVLVGGPWDGRSDWILAGVPELLVPTFDPEAVRSIGPSDPGERVVYVPHRYRLIPMLSSEAGCVYVHSDIADDDVLQVLVQGYRKERKPTSIRLSDIYQTVQIRSGPQSA